MANTKAFTKVIMPNTADGSEQNAVHETSPAWVLTFVRWQVRDPLRTHSSTPNSVRDPLVVENDCVTVNTVFNKGTLTPSMSATLKSTDVNYATEIAPGDFVFVNMLSWESSARRVADKARAKQPINETNDGFKGIFKVQGVRKNIVVDPSTGTKTVFYRIDAFGFTEFNNTIYFNPNLVNQKNISNQALYINDLQGTWASLTSNQGKPYCQEIVAFLIQSLIGTGFNPNAAKVDGMVATVNTHFLLPILVGRLLGTSNSLAIDNKDYSTAIAAKDIFQYLFGIQQYSGGAGQQLATGMNPSNLQAIPPYPGFYYTNQMCPGNTLLKPEYWNQVNTWSILNQYTNSPLNEFYTCYRISPIGRVMPTVVMRQIPFTSEDFATQKFGTQDATAQSINVTRFLTLPRWKLDASTIYSVDIGKDEAARINFVQFYAKSNYTKDGFEISGETASGNYIFDSADIQRSGLRPYVIQNQFDDLPDLLVKSAPIWARIMGDALIGGHLKLNGTINCIGIVDAIAVGDNLEFNGTVYHIEQISHACSISPENGMKQFRTTLSLSHGVSVNSSASGTLYSEMTYASAYDDRTNDAGNSQILPGVSESQDTFYRSSDNLDLPRSGGAPFVQPSTTGKIRTGE
jgi:hypothetical protein